MKRPLLRVMRLVLGNLLVFLVLFELASAAFISSRPASFLIPATKIASKQPKLS